MSEGRSVTLEGNMVVIRVPCTEVHAIRVACCSECPCGAAKAREGVDLRAALNRALGRVIS